MVEIKGRKPVAILEAKTVGLSNASDMNLLSDTMLYTIQQLCFVMYSVLVTGKIKPNKSPLARN